MVRLYKVWPGNNRFLCGCCVSGPANQIGGIIFIQVGVLIVTIPFSIFVFKVNAQITPALPALFYVLLGLMQIFLFITACSNPGIIPRKPILSLNKQKFKNFLEEQGGTNLKICQTCQILKPNRASHCSSCQNCVQVFDHHCGILGNCIGRRNYRFFVAFVTCVFLSIVIGIINMVFFIAQKQLSEVSQTITIALVAIVGTILGLPIAFFCIFHTFLSVTHSTTKECLKKASQVRENNQNIWCGVDQPLLDPFLEISQEESDLISIQIKKMREGAGDLHAVSLNTTTDHIK